MSKFKSIFNYKYYFGGLLVLLVPGFLAVMGLWGLTENILKGEALTKWGFTIVMPGISLAFIAATIRHFYLLSPRIIITEKEVHIGKNVIMISDIKLISVRGKTSVYYLIFPYTYESSSILLRNEEEFTIAVENYINGHVIRMNLDQMKNYLLGKVERFVPIEADDHFRSNAETIDTRTAARFMQSPLKSVNNYLFVGMCGFMIWMMFQFKDGPGFLMLFPVTMISMFYLILVFQNHYFLLTSNHLIIKNLFLPTRQKIFKFDEIDYLETEDSPKQETALKVITKNFKIYRFQSGLMNYEMFTEMIRTINERRNADVS